MNEKIENTALAILNVLIYPVMAVVTKTYYTSLLASHDIFLKAYHEGIYHFTTEANIDQIMKSKDMHSSGALVSYGKRKCFFFPGIPDFDTYCINANFAYKLTALKLNPSYEQLTAFDCRPINDHAVTHTGDLDLNSIKLEKVYFVLKEDNGRLYFDPVDYQTYESYNPQFKSNKDKIIQHMVGTLRCYKDGLRKEYEISLNNLRTFLKDQNSGLKLYRSQEPMKTGESDVLVDEKAKKNIR